MIDKEIRPIDPTEFLPWAEYGVTLALNHIRIQYENNADPAANLESHNTRHTLQVMDRGERIFRVISPDLYVSTGLAWHDFVLLRYVCALHDLVNESEPKDENIPGKEPRLFRQRFTGQNERESAEQGIVWMNTINALSGREWFKDRDREIAREGITATIPGFDPNLGTVIQPHRKENPSPVALCLALADLGTAGMDGGEAFIAEGSALFREENLDIAEAIRTGAELTDDQKESFRKRMLGWSKFQPTFARGRQALLDTEIACLPEAARKRLKEQVFTKFDDSIAAATAKAEAREKMPFDELVTDMGYRSDGGDQHDK